MMQRLGFVGLLVVPISAGATPIQLVHQARVLDADGVPLNTPVTLTVGIYPDGGTSAALWDDDYTVTPEDGYVSLILGQDTVGDPLDDSVFDGSPRYVGVSMGGTSLGPRQLIATVPSAVHARNVSGGTVQTAVLRLGADTNTCPDGSASGSVRWSAAERALEVCDGSGWRSVMTDTPGSCKELQAEDPSRTSGTYFVTPGTGAPLEVYCDMTTSPARTLLMRIEGTTSEHVTNNERFGPYPCTPTSTTCKLSSDEISRFIHEDGVEVFEIDPDPAGYLSWFQRAASGVERWPTNLEASNRPSLAGSASWSWVLTSYQSYADAAAGTSGTTGNYASPSHYYPTVYGTAQIFFRGSGTGLRANTTWTTSGYSDGISGTLWVY